MDSKAMKNEINSIFPNAEHGRIFFAKKNILLEEEYGFTPGNTRFAEGGCSDEINETEYRFMESHWKDRFKIGGLAGYCHGGKTGMAAVSHHVPEVDGIRNLLLLAGPHIGYYRGEWGKIPRRGQHEITTSCGSIESILSIGYHEIIKKNIDPLDRQQETVEQLLLPYLKTCVDENRIPDMAEATKFLMAIIDRDLNQLVQECESQFKGQIAIITGITINTELGNYFSQSIFEVRGRPISGVLK